MIFRFKGNCKSAVFLTILFIVLNFAACAANRGALSQEEIDAYYDRQEKWLTSLGEGMTPAEALDQVSSYKHYVFRFHDGERSFQYVRGKYPGTDTLYGLFFQDNRLTSILVDQPVMDLDLCRSSHMREEDAWPLSGFEGTVAWIRSRNRLGDDYADLRQVQRTTETNGDGPSGGDIVEIATHLPLAVLAAPVYGIYKVAGGSEEKEAAEQENGIAPGRTTGAQLLEMHGNPMYRRKHDKYEVLRYRVPDASFGVAEGLVRWSEYNWWGTPSNDRTSPSGTACVLPEN